MSAVISDLSKVGNPLFNDLTAPSLDNVHDVVQRMGWYVGIVVTQVAPPSLSDPYLCCPGTRRAKADMNIDWLKRVILI